MRAIRIAVGVAGLATAVALAGVPAGAAAPAAEAGVAASGPQTEYVVLYRDAKHAADARAAIRKAGGSVVSENAAIGTALVRAARPDFTSVVRRSPAVTGSTHNRPIGHLPTPAHSLVERLAPADRAAALRALPAAPALRPAETGSAPAEEPLAPLQWDMKMIGATAAGSYAVAPGDRRVRVGIIDTGVDGTHPDIAPNFDRADSRNFTTDIPAADGPCETTSCVDPVDEDDNGHGTHVASTIGAPINGLGMAGVAPNVTLVNLRAGQDSGFFFLQPTVDALTYAGDSGIDVVNMSFYVDPWLYNCASNPADSPEAQAEQRTVVEAVQRAVTYAVHHGVTPFAALGNESTDLGDPDSDPTSPDYPDGKSYDRVVDNGCVTVPAETVGVLSVSALGPSGRKAAYSNYGVEQTDLSAPGGDAFDSPDNKVDPTRMILAAYPANVARAEGALDAKGEPRTPFVVKSCRDDVCGYYQYLQGTSMATPHAVGVAALAVSRFGRLGGTGAGAGNPSVASDADGLTLEPYLTTLALWASAERRPCPSPPAYTYTVDGASGKQTFTHVCEQGLGGNGFYGRGMVSAAGIAALPALGTMPPSAAPTALR